jgi:hypothetical protein
LFNNWVNFDKDLYVGCRDIRKKVVAEPAESFSKTRDLRKISLNRPCRRKPNVVDELKL